MKNFSSFLFAIRTLWIPKGAKKDTGKIGGAILGIIFSIIPIIIVLQVASGMIFGITDRFLNVAGYHFTVTSMTKNIFADKDSIIKKIKTVPEVKESYFTVEGEGVLISKNKKNVVMLKGIPDNIKDIDKDFFKYIDIIDGEFNIGNPENILISKDVGKKLNLKLGDKVKVLVNKKKFNRNFIGFQDFTVSGIFTTGYFEIDNVLTYINLDKSLELFGDHSKSTIGIKIDNPYQKNLNNISDKIVDAIDSDDYIIRTWKENNRSLVQNLDSTLSMIIVIAIIIILISSTNILSVMIMFQMEKRVDIAILKSCGVGEKTIFTSFVLISFFIGLIGSVIGLFLGLFVSVNINFLISSIDHIYMYFHNFFNFLLGKEFLVNNIDFFNKEYYLNYIPFVIKSWHIYMVVILSVTMSGFVGIIPALIACKVKPLNVIRKF